MLWCCSWHGKDKVKMKKMRSLIFIWFFQMLFSRAVDAYPASNFYIGAALGGAYFGKACSSNSVGCDNQQLLYGANIGLELSDWLSSEAGLYSYGEPNAQYISSNVSAKVWGADLSLLLKYALDMQSRFYMRAGGGLFNIEKSQRNGFSSNLENQQVIKPILGVGVEYDVSQSWSGRLEYRLIKDFGGSEVGHSDLHALMFNVLYRIDFSGLMAPGFKSLADSQRNSSLLYTVGEALPAHLAGTETIYFAPDSSLLTPTALHLLDDVVRNILALQTDVVVIAAHTDSTASTRHNVQLAQRRASVVKAYLEEKGAVSRNIKVDIYGESQPIADNTTAIGRESNRRVEISLK